MRFSVIIPVYRAEKYIDRAVRSITEQSFRDFELILVDDGSPDRSGALCEIWKAKDSRVRVFHQLNHGVAAARNHGLREAHGDYIVFVDADDYIDTGLLEEADKVITSAGADVVLVNIKRFFRDNDIRQPLLYVDHTTDGEKQLRYLLCGLFPEAVSKIFKRSLITGSAFNERLNSAEDRAFIPEIVGTGCRTAAVENHFYYYNKMNENSTTRTYPKIGAALNNYYAWHHFLHSSLRYGWERLDGRLPRLYRVQCLRFAAQSLLLDGKKELTGEDRSRLTAFLAAHGPDWLADRPSARELAYMLYYAAYEASRLIWYITGGISGGYQTRIIRELCRFYSVECAGPHLDQEGAGALSAFIASLLSYRNPPRLSLGQRASFYLVSHHADRLLSLIGDRRLKRCGQGAFE